ncbi:hypothetical protein DCO58_11685 [Helicobacter saguini]|uniref:Uncharacterized protein n=1 Tax=Helicobacter saguini TaxID=1548018 RepID=A0A347VQ74_9HELI|nr:hypothetical protein [Helicobacter saguini]MWV61049.1 hypothetical protein [Helicobacter saguini]MWV68282.1 hypothetical protein [Helicobacter saguini]MWV70253.1 hypothetical protein [Helicobacter saguini]MWV72156.1 hypothetical protein [Helicobacter saguini]TLD95217.1 hypothetical protein LS64_002300 [Helicobacter saguini]
MQVSLDNKSSAKSQQAWQIKGFLYKSYFIFLALIAFWACSFVLGIINISSISSSSFSFSGHDYDGMGMFFDMLNTFDTKLKKIEATQNLLQFLFVVNMIIFVVSIFVLNAFKKLSDFTRSGLFSCFVRGMVVNFLCVVAFIILCELSESYNVNVRGLCVVAGSGLIVGFCVYLLYVYHRICRVMHEITNVSDFLESFKSMLVSTFMTLPLMLYVGGQMLWLDIDDFAEKISNSWALTPMFFIFAMAFAIGFNAQVFFISGIRKIKILNIKE